MPNSPFDAYQGLGPEGFSQSDLRFEALECFGDCDDGDLHPNDAHWTYHPALPLSTLEAVQSRSQWLDWFEQENVWAAEDGRPGYTYLVHQDIIQPIVLTIIGEKVTIWGGWHRTGASFAKSAETIRAIVGVPKISP